MFSIFPKVYKDELLYSWMSRYTSINGNINERFDREDLFGRCTYKYDIIIQSNLSFFISQLPREWGYTVESLIYNHTVFPVFFKFISEEKQKKVINKLYKSTSSTIAKEVCLNIENSLSKMNYINICEQCYEEDKERYGEAYIHRNYQIQGCFMCAKHKKNIKKVLS